jgi:16S rRNA (adenine1518-N6/adenine1519-N6)-dimethyltransferase
MKPKRWLGQFFLQDRTYQQKILEHLDIEGEGVLEIGPGKGQMSLHLSRKAKNLYCLEIDPRLCSFLTDIFVDQPGVQVIHADILKFPLSRLGQKLVIFGNIPYRISSRLITYLVENRSHIKRAYLTLQDEFSRKLLAPVSTEHYSFISCYVQYHAHLRRLLDIPPGAFWPRPKVNSTFVSMEFLPRPHPAATDEEHLFKVIGKAFRNRRKKISNSLPVPGGRAFFEGLDVSPDSRAEDITLEEYVRLANKLYPYFSF